MKTNLRIELDDDLKVHREEALKFICKGFSSHENGIPEWIKNSSDEYCRRQNAGFDIAPEERVILLILKNGRGGQLAQLACLDFSGMTRDVIEKFFRVWVDPESANRGGEASGVQGGHGNGGKCYMSHMFQDHAYLLTVREGKGNKYGVEGGQFRFGFMPNRKSGRDFPVNNERRFLSEVLEEFGLRYRDLPEGARQLFERTNGFTLTCGVGPKGFKNKLPVKRIVSNLAMHAQMAQSIGDNQLFVVANGAFEEDGNPLELPEIKPREGFGEPRVIEIPQRLRDPLTGEKTPTCKDGDTGKRQLILRTSERSMYHKLKGRHNVTYHTQTASIGYCEVRQIGVKSGYAQYIYGECHLDSLEEDKSNARYHLENSPLSRAVNGFVAGQIDRYAKVFEDQELKKYGRKAKDEISRLNDYLNDWKNRFLKDILTGFSGGEGDSPSGAREALPTGIPERMHVDMQYCRAGVGVSFRPRIRFFNRDNEQIRSVPYRWVSEDTNVAMVNEDLNVIDTFSIGETLIYAETLDDKLFSDKLPLHVVNIHKIELEPSKVKLSAGGRSSLVAKCLLDDGSVVPDVCLIWDEDSTDIARVSSSGTVFGVSEGTTQVTARDERCEAKHNAVIQVGPPDGSGQGKHHGRGFPKILVSGVDKDPDSDQDRAFGKDEPPVVQYPEDADRNIYWINSASPMASLFIDREKYGPESREWRMYLVERHTEVIIRIALSRDDNVLSPLTLEEWQREWGGQAARIQESALSELTDFIATGQVARR